ncbi:MAG: hypothetical protein JSV53_05710, partial [candidate division WOR-3 bacterium]
MISIFLALLISSQAVSGPVMHFFYRPSCGHCMDILLADIPDLQKKYVFSVKKYDIDLMNNYKLLEKMEAAKDIYGDDLPAIFLGDSVFYGPESLYQKLEVVLKAFPKREPPVVKDVEKIDTIPLIETHVDILYFFQPGCRECARLDALFGNLERNYENISVSRYSIFEDTNKVMLEALSARTGIPE